MSDEAFTDFCIRWLKIERSCLLHDIKRKNEDIALLQAQFDRVTAERDAALNDLNGLCWCCRQAKPWAITQTGSRIMICDHMKERGVVASAGRAWTCCTHWEWRGPQKEGGDG